jgi:hypothetical protein
MQFRYRGFVILVRDDHGFVRALVLDPLRPRWFRRLPALDARDAERVARAYVDGLCDTEAERVMRTVSA